MATPHSHNLIHAAREQLKFSIYYIIVSIKRISNSKSVTYLPLLFMKLQDSVLFSLNSQMRGQGGAKMHVSRVN